MLLLLLPVMLSVPIYVVTTDSMLSVRSLC